MNKRGWLKIIEASLAILLIIGVILFVLNKTNVLREDISSRVYDTQLSILREIEHNDDFRQKILSIQNTDLPVKWNDFQSKGLGDVENKIKKRSPEYLNCEAKICAMDDFCNIDKLYEKNIYSQSIIISATNIIYSPKQLKLFCWVK
jgi:hypothetical protein